MIIIIIHDNCLQLVWSGIVNSEETSLVDSGWTHIFASPEALLESPRWRKLLLSSNLMDRLVDIVINEAHCI